MYFFLIISLKELQIMLFKYSTAKLLKSNWKKIELEFGDFFSVWSYCLHISCYGVIIGFLFANLTLKENRKYFII